MTLTTQVRFAVLVLSFGAPAVAAGQGTDSRVSVLGAFGSLVNTGGNSEAISLGFSPSEHVTLLVSAERIHMPTKVTRTDNTYEASRGGTSKFICGEIRFSPFTFNRVLPYGLGGAGCGTTRANVNDVFPDPVTTEGGAVLFVGGGVRVPITEHLSTFADMRFILQVDNSETGVFLFVPVRGGLAWRF